MSGLRVLIVLGTVPDLFKMFNSIIGPFHRTMADTLLRSSLAGIRLLRGLPEKSGSLRTKSKRATMNIRVPLVLESYANGMTTAYFYLLSVTRV
jgi:hypothetical protein